MKPTQESKLELVVFGGQKKTRHHFARKKKKKTHSKNKPKVTYNPTDIQPASRGDTLKKCPNQAGCTFKRFLSIEMTPIWWIWANDRPEFP